MALTSGTRIGSYEIAGQIGAGGMGEVYRASDTKLKREVAIKVLPTAVASDTVQLARLQREAELLASLNHPNVAAIYGLEDLAGSKALVMELVEGPTLAERIASGPIGLDEAIAIAGQIAQAVTAAHERGVVHRDLKPSNVKVRPDGTVKVLDFGLAKAMASARLPGSTQARTITVASQVMGPGPGTPAYMSPEQARGAAVDHRTDIWAFGCVLYEMLAGRAAFDGSSVTDVLSGVLQTEPDWQRLPAGVPASIRRLLRLCLEKNPTERRQSAGDVRIDLNLALTEPDPASPTPPRKRSRLTRAVLIGTAAALAAALAIPAALHLRETPPPEMRLQIVTPPTLTPLEFALSPDGRHVVFVAADPAEGDAERLHLRALNETEARPLADTEGARHPFWSPDGQSIGFFASDRLLRIDITGGPPQTVAPAVNALGGAWGADGTILFAPDSVSPLFRVAESGGTPVAATELDSPRQKNHRRPTFLPDGRRFLFYVEGEPEASGLYLASLDGGAAQRLAAADDSRAAYLPPDLVVFARQGALVARRLDGDGDLTGDVLTVVPSTSADRDGLSSPSASATGILAFRSESDSSNAGARTTWFDRDGNVLEVRADFWNGPELSPGDRHAAYDHTVAGNRDVWILDLVRGGSVRFTTHPAVDGYPVWSPDGRELVFESQRNGTFDLWIKPFSGAEEERLLLESADNEIPIGWSSDGRFLLYRSSNENYTSADLLALPMTGDDRTPLVVASTQFEERMGEFSPDGRWVAYDTNESGRFEVRVQAFPEAEGSWAVSTDGGVAPRWPTDGEIHFIAPDGTVMAVRVTTTASSFRAERPAPLFPTRILSQTFNHQYALARDGRFVVNNRQAEALAEPITVLVNWRP